MLGTELHPCPAQGSFRAAVMIGKEGCEFCSQQLPLCGAELPEYLCAPRLRVRKLEQKVLVKHCRKAFQRGSMGNRYNLHGGLTSSL